MKTTPTNYWSLIILTSLAPIIWGSTYVVTTEMLPDNIPLITATIRTLPLGLLITLFMREPLNNQLGQFTAIKMVVLALLNISIFQAMLFMGAYRLPGGIVAVIGSVQPLVIMLLIWLIEHKKPKLKTIIAVFATMCGMALLLIKPNLAFDWDIIGVLASVVGSIAMAVGMYLTKYWQEQAQINSKNKQPNMITFTGWQLLLGGLFLLPVALYIENIPNQISMMNAVGFGYLSVIGSAVAYSLWMNGIVKLPTVTVSILGAFSPITAVLLGWMLLGQAFSRLQMIGFIIALVSVLFVQRQVSPK